MTTPEYLARVVLPAAEALLPPQMASPAARALLVAIALQESRCTARAQFHGPAKGLFQFEVTGCADVLTHPASRTHLEAVLQTLLYPPAASAVYEAIEHDDILAAVCARLLLWTDAQPLPTADQAEQGWRLYQRCWRPGRPRPETWGTNFAEAWMLCGVVV